MRQSGAAVGGLFFCFVVHDYKSYYKCEMSRCWYFCFKKRRPRRFKRQKRDFLRWAFKNGPDKLEIVKIGGLSWELEVTQKSVVMAHYLSCHGSTSVRVLCLHLAPAFCTDNVRRALVGYRVGVRERRSKSILFSSIKRPFRVFKPIWMKKFKQMQNQQNAKVAAVDKV